MKATTILLTALLAVVALLVGCGGNGQNPPPVILDPTLEYPAYHARSAEGEDLYLQFRSEQGSISGSYYFFFQEDGQTQIGSGSVTGSETEGGELTLTLHNPFENDLPDISVEGNRTETGMTLWDVENPEETFDFTKTTGPASPQASRGIFSSNGAWLALTTTDRYPNRWADWHTLYVYSAPHWFLPLTYEASVNGTQSLLKGSHKAYAHGWGNGWSWVDIWVAGSLKGRLWFKSNPDKLATWSTLSMHADSRLDVGHGWNPVFGVLHAHGSDSTGMPPEMVR